MSGARASRGRGRAKHGAPGQTSSGIGARFSADDKSFSVLIDNPNNTASPRVGRLRDFVGINPVLGSGGTIICRAHRAQFFGWGCSLYHFDLTAADKFVTATAKALLVERFPVSQRIQSTQKD